MVNLEYCYAQTPTGGTCSTANKDMNFLQFRHDHVSGIRTTYERYDDSDRLDKAVEGTRIYEYDYDKNGNRIWDTTSGLTSYSYAHDVADALCSRRSGTTTGANCTDTSNTTTTTVYSHDGAGNMTAAGATAIAYNGASQMTQYGTPTFSYAGTGQGDRLRAGSTTFTNGLLDVQQTTNSSGLNTDVGSTPDGQLVSITMPDSNSSTGRSRHYYLFDGQGSVIGLTADADGTRTATYTYDPYGAHHTASGTHASGNRFRYIGGYLDTTGLYKLGIRYYNPQLGRFTQLDPTGQDPHYTYGQNSPCNYTDPTGALSECGVFLAGVGLVAFGLVTGGIGLAVGITAVTTTAGAVGYGTTLAGLGGTAAGAGLLDADDC